MIQNVSHDDITTAIYFQTEHQNVGQRTSKHTKMVHNSSYLQGCAVIFLLLFVFSAAGFQSFILLIDYIYIAEMLLHWFFL